MQFVPEKFADKKKVRIFAVLFREHSSVGLEHLPYKQRVGGSTPSAPTKSLSSSLERLFSFICLSRMDLMWSVLQHHELSPRKCILFIRQGIKKGISFAKWVLSPKKAISFWGHTDLSCRCKVQQQFLDKAFLLKC